MERLGKYIQPAVSLAALIALLAVAFVPIVSFATAASDARTAIEEIRFVIRALEARLARERDALAGLQNAVAFDGPAGGVSVEEQSATVSARCRKLQSVFADHAADASGGCRVATAPLTEGYSLVRAELAGAGPAEAVFSALAEANDLMVSRLSIDAGPSPGSASPLNFRLQFYAVAREAGVAP